MNNREKHRRAEESVGPLSAARNLLSSVAPPTGLPTFVTSVVPASQLPPSMQPTNSQTCVPSPAAVAPTPASPDKFSPAIPPQKGEPTLAIRPPEGSQTTTRSQVSPADSTPDLEHIGDPMPGSGLLTWVRGAVSTAGPGWLHRVAEKAKSSVDSMITTLDPQMKEYINSGGDVSIVVASEEESDVSPVREAFQTVFGKASVVGVAVEKGDATAAQAVGAGAALAAAKHRVALLRSAHPQLHNDVPIVTLEAFLMEIPSDKWLEANLLLISQPSLGVELQMVSQCTPVPAAVLPVLRAATPQDYPHADTGLAVTAASVLAHSLQVSPHDWHETLTCVSRREVLVLAARALAGSYKKLLHLSAGAGT